MCSFTDFKPCMLGGGKGKKERKLDVYLLLQKVTNREEKKKSTKHKEF